MSLNAAAAERAVAARGRGGRARVRASRRPGRRPWLALSVRPCPRACQLGPCTSSSPAAHFGGCAHSPGAAFANCGAAPFDLVFGGAACQGTTAFGSAAATTKAPPPTCSRAGSRAPGRAPFRRPPSCLAHFPVLHANARPTRLGRGRSPRRRPAAPLRPDWGCPLGQRRRGVLRGRARFPRELQQQPSARTEAWGALFGHAANVSGIRAAPRRGESRRRSPAAPPVERVF